jgi:hypothetical protein
LAKLGDSPEGFPQDAFVELGFAACAIREDNRDFHDMESQLPGAERHLDLEDEAIGTDALQADLFREPGGGNSGIRWWRLSGASL